MNAETPESFSFQAEVVQVLDLMIHSMYSNKEIFLRELISNSSDAIDRLRLERFSRPELEADDPDSPLQIHVGYDAGARTITISDNGIGMSREEVIKNIGTIAKSGTREFLHALTGDQRKDATLIGQFGVGFYSAFIVAERVLLTTRRAGAPAGEGVRWESDGQGAYTLEQVEHPARGTTVVLQLREGEDELLNSYRLRSIIQRYSDHISQPILMPAEAAGDDQPAGEEVVNQASAIWTRPKSELSDEDYHAFYRHVASDFAEPLAYVHSKIEGTYEYTLLLFIPAKAPYDLWLPEARPGVRLHVRRVFIMADTGQLLPGYLRFIRGVIDSEDLPLNVSRELLQGSRAVDHIRSTAVKRVLRLLRDLAENEPDKYATFWGEFGAVLKEGVGTDFSNRDELARLLRFTSTASGTSEADVSLSSYVARMKEGQDKIYYLLAPTLAGARTSPHLEAFREKGIEVLLLGDPVDNWLVPSLREFDGRPLQSVAQGIPDFGDLDDDAAQQARTQAAADFEALVAALKASLAGQAWDVRVSSRLTTSPACIVANEPDLELNLARRLRDSGMPSQPVLEINPQHPLIRRLNRSLEDPQLDDWAHVLYNQAILTLGARIDDPAAFVSRLNELLVALAAEPGAGAGPGVAEAGAGAGAGVAEAG
ncbi:MAG TPA: molecular chaperone HtpG, partial [Streptosporangiaceae bacterium]|nr:molecular chaperone HtpG [Streptosporangiaceae bacterium]